MFWITETRFVLPRTLTRGGEYAYSPEAGFELSVVECGGQPFTEMILSWNADTPPGTAILAEARLRYAAEDAAPETGVWSAWVSIGKWGSGSHDGQRLPRSHTGEAGDPTVRLEVDTIRLEAGHVADAFQARLTLYGGTGTPTMRLLATSTCHRGAAIPDAFADPPLGREVRLAVPVRSQRDERAEIAGEICSPTSLGMVMHYYGIDQGTGEIADAVFDHGAEIYGNWPFNTAYAGSHGLRAVVRHMSSMGEIEHELEAGRPVIISVAFGPGELPDAPIPSSDGHLIVVTGVTEQGVFLVNDPAARIREGQAVERLYSREHLRQVFMRHGGVAYIIERQSE